MEADPNYTEHQEEFVMSTGETIKVRHYIYEYPDKMTHHLYDIWLVTPRGYQAIYRATESEISERKKD